MTIRPYQSAALDACDDAWNELTQALLIVLPTGTGKTVIFCELLRRVAPKRGLVVTHKKDLVVQTSKRIREWCDEPVGIEMADQRDISRPRNDSLDLFDGSTGDRPRLCVASVQSLTEARLGEIPRDLFDFVILDEAHHATARTWIDVVNHFASARVLGVTATPDRADGKALGKIFQSVAYEYRMEDAIDDGWLVAPVLYLVRCSLDLDSVKRKKGGDFDEGDLANKMMDQRIMQEICDPLMAERKDRPAILFVAGVAQAHAYAAYMNSVAGRDDWAMAVDASTPMKAREPIYAGLASGRHACLVNVGILTEGWDCPAVSLVGLGRPTASRPLYAQMIGRGTRPHPASGKKDLMVLDYRWMSERHDIVTLVDIFQGDLSDAVVKKAKDKAEDSAECWDDDSEPIDVRDLLATSLHDFQQERLALRYTLIRKDPFAAVGIDLASYQDGVIKEFLTPAQRDWLVRKGVKEADVAKLSKKHASTIIANLQARANDGLCTPKQARILARSGIDPMNVSFEHAGALIDMIAKRDWKPLPDAFDVKAWFEARKAGV